ncbi:hypothetical protein [Acidisoma sp. 7E03]
MRRRKKSLLPKVTSLDAFGLLGGGLLAYHDDLKGEGFTLAAKAIARPRTDGSWRIRFVWKKRDGECAIVISRSVIMQREMKKGHVETPKIVISNIPGTIAANA